MTDIEQAKRKIRMSGMKLTTQRISILKILHHNRSHPTAMDIFKKLKLRHPTVSFTTVYNTLELLTGLGEIRKITVDFERAHYDPDTSQHHHALCQQCGAIFDIEERFDLPVEKMAFREFPMITGYHIEFRGFCSTCAESLKEA